LLVLVPATASAAPFGELPFRPVSGTATCLRATGTPGELVRQSEQTVQLVTASPAGLTAGATLAADGIRGCAETASWAGGGGLVAFAVSSDLEDELWARVYVREPGGVILRVSAVRAVTHARAYDDGNARGSAGHVMKVGCLVDELVHGRR